MLNALVFYRNYEIVARCYHVNLYNLHFINGKHRVLEFFEGILIKFAFDALLRVEWVVSLFGNVWPSRWRPSGEIRG